MEITLIQKRILPEIISLLIEYRHNRRRRRQVLKCICIPRCHGTVLCFFLFLFLINFKVFLA